VASRYNWNSEGTEDCGEVILGKELPASPREEKNLTSVDELDPEKPLTLVLLIHSPSQIFYEDLLASNLLNNIDRNPYRGQQQEENQSTGEKV
jgi:hypothetical protein